MENRPDRQGRKLSRESRNNQCSISAQRAEQILTGLEEQEALEMFIMLISFVNKRAPGTARAILCIYQPASVAFSNERA